MKITILDAYGFSTHEQLVAWIAKTYGLTVETQALNPHRIRRERIAQRLRLYRNDGRAEFERLIERIFTKADVQDQRKKMLDVATEQNVTQRIVHEVASLYDQPAVRELASKDDTAKLKELATELELDEVMQEGQRLTFLCNETLLWRTKDEEGDELRLITPDAFDAIPHPRRKLREIGFLLDAAPGFIPQGVDPRRLPHYELWDSTYRYLISAEGKLVDENGGPASSPIEHGQDGIPGVLMHRRKPVDCILDDRAGRDITAAHLGVGLLEVMAMRLMKSQGERQPVLQGNLAAYAAGQSMDGEKPLMLPPEVVASMLDTKTDPDHYMRKSKDKVTAVCLSYGINYDQYTNSESDMSGRAYQLRRAKLTEIRNEQVRRGIVHERRVMVLVGFDSKGMTVDYQEQTIPQDAAEEIALLKEKMPLGLDSPVQYRMRKNPEETREQAIASIRKNLAEYALLMLEVRALNMPSNANADNTGKSPQENGADGGKSSGSDPAGGKPDLRKIAREVINAA